MQEILNPEFNKVVSEIYKYKLNNSDKLINKENIETFHSQAQALAHIISHSLTSSLQEATEFIYSKNTEQLHFTININTNNYIDFLTNKLDEKDDNGPLLAAQFIKKVQSLEFPPYLNISYDMAIEPNDLIVGFCQFDKEPSLEKIHQCYKDVIFPEFLKDIKDDIYQLLPDVSEVELEEIANISAQNILNTQFNENNPFAVPYSSLNKILNKCSTIKKDEQTYEQKEFCKFFDECIQKTHEKHNQFKIR